MALQQTHSWLQHLKGQLDPPVGDVTFLDQSRSVGPPCWLREVFGSMQVGWIPMLVTGCFWIKAGQLDPLAGNVPEMQKRSSGNTEMQLQNVPA